MGFEMIAKPTPTLLRTLAGDDTPRVHVKVEAGRCEDFHGIGLYLVRGISELLFVAHAGVYTLSTGLDPTTDIITSVSTSTDLPFREGEGASFQHAAANHLA